MILETDAEHQNLIGRAMFIAANAEIFGGFVLAIVVLILIIYFVRRKKT
ncbi:MAG: hypothetical protein PVG08_18290 [Desulfobacterales bacterium]